MLYKKGIAFMENIFFSVIKEGCKEVSSSLKENGLLEIIMPKDCSDEHYKNFFEGLGVDECNKIVDKQKKAKEVFRNKVKNMIDKYRDELNLPFMINLRIMANTKKLSDCNVELNGIIFEGNILFSAILQYFSDELVEKIIKSEVVSIACEYETQFSMIKGVIVNRIDLKNGKNESSKYEGVPEEIKYRNPLEYSEIRNIKADYVSAVRIIVDDLRKQAIIACKVKI